MQFFEGSIQGEEIKRIAIVREFTYFAQVNLVVALPSLGGIPGARSFNQNAPHGGCGDSEELRTVLPAYAALVDHSKINFVYKRRRLQRIVGALAAKIAF